MTEVSLGNKALRCLVTGGLGYAGAWIAHRLSSNGHETHILSRRSEKADIGRPYSLIQADLAERTPEEIGASLPEKLDCVIHAASRNEACEPEYPRKALEANALGTRNLLQALLSRYGSGKDALPLLIYMSTFHVYGRTDGAISESDEPEPRNDYALTHFFAEEYCRMWARLFGLPCIVLRISNCYGAPKTPKSDKWGLLLNDLCKQAATQGEVTLRSDPSTLRDFVWMGDLAEIMEKLLSRKDLAGRLFNLAAGKAVSIGSAAELVAAAASELYGRPVPLKCASAAKISSSEAFLRIDNRALCSAIDFRFRDRMREEIVDLLHMAAGVR